MSRPPLDRRAITARVGASAAAGLGVVTALAGAALIVFAHAVVQPFVSDGLAGVRRALGEVERAIEAAQPRGVARLLDDSAALLAALGSTLNHAPDLMKEAADTTAASADVLRASAKDLRTLAASVDLFVNEEGLVRTSREMDQTAAQMTALVKETRALAGSLRRVQAAYRAVSEALDGLLTRASAAWRDELSGAPAAIRGVGDALEATTLPLVLALCFDAFGLALLALGALLIALASSLRRAAAQS